MWNHKRVVQAKCIENKLQHCKNRYVIMQLITYEKIMWKGHTVTNKCSFVNNMFYEDHVVWFLIIWY